jgi:uncharacterized protein (TIGR03435 family)
MADFFSKIEVGFGIGSTFPKTAAFALTLLKPGKTGPRLRPHAGGPACPDSYKPPSPGGSPSAGDVFPPNCETAQNRRTSNGMWLAGSRITNMSSLADAIYSYGYIAGEVDKPVVDQTGLSGTFDFTIEYLPGENNRFRRSGAPNSDDRPRVTEWPTFLDAMRQQLGLRLVSSKGSMRMLVIDYVERPFGN